MNARSDITNGHKPATVTMSFDPSAMAAMDGGERSALYLAFFVAAEALHGVMLQPRCETNGYLNHAGRVIETMVEFFGKCTDALVKAERTRKETNPVESEKHLFLLLHHEARMGDDLARLAAMASQCVVEQRSCEWCAEHDPKQVAA